MTFKPLLASPVDLATLRYPVWVSGKLDGIRAVVIDGVLMSRNLKPIRNRHVQTLFGKPEYNGFDGELILGDPLAKGCFQQTQSAVGSFDGEPSIKFHVFDYIGENYAYARYRDRYHRMNNVLQSIADWDKNFVPVCSDVVQDQETLEWVEQSYVEDGWEGVMLRDPDGYYKMGRSTTKEGILLKMKRFADGEAEILEVIQARTNQNEITQNELGENTRSSHKANVFLKEEVGGFRVRDLVSGVDFQVGSGLTAEQRQTWWCEHIRPTLLGKIVKYKSQLVGVKDKPRFPVFLGFREPWDLL